MSRSDPNSDLGSQMCRNVIVAGRRTSIRMEQIYWQELQNAVEREGWPMNEIVSMVDLRRGSTNLTAALRVFIICYMQGGPSSRSEDADGSPDGGDGSGNPGGRRPCPGRIARALDVVGPPRRSTKS